MGTKITTEERENAATYLRELFPPGATVTTHVEHVSRSGMQRGISVLACSDGLPCDVSWAVGRVIGAPLHRAGGVKIGGAGMDMGFHVVYTLARTLYPDGYPCNGSDAPLYAGGCPSPDHVNRDTRDDPPAVHHDGYALRHRWLS